MLDVGPKTVAGNETETAALRVWVRDKVPRDSLSRPVPRILRHEAFPDVPTDVIAVNVPVATPSTGFPIHPGRSCSRRNDVPGTGTMTCFGNTPDGPHAMTAGHVLALSGATDPRIVVHGAAIADTPSSSLVGRIHPDNILLELDETNSVDVAAYEIKPTQVHRFVPRPLGVGPVQGVRPQDSLTRGERVHVFGASSQRTMIGRVYKNSSSREALFSVGNISYKLVDYVDVRFPPSERPIGGDSGSLVVDMRGYAVGIYVGGAHTSSQRYVVPLDRALDDLDFQPEWQ